MKLEFLRKPKLILTIDLFITFAKLLELLAINHSSERRDVFVPRLLKLSHVLVVLQLAWMPIPRS